MVDVEALRFLASGQDDPHSVALDEAADEIERLRAALVELTRLDPPQEVRANVREVVYGHNAREFALRVLAGPNV